MSSSFVRDSLTRFSSNDVTAAMAISRKLFESTLLSSNLSAVAGPQSMVSCFYTCNTLPRRRKAWYLLQQESYCLMEDGRWAFSIVSTAEGRNRLASPALRNSRRSSVKASGPPARVLWENERNRGSRAVSWEAKRSTSGVPYLSVRDFNTSGLSCHSTDLPLKRESASTQVLSTPSHVSC
ncbi:hypothetical protein E2C01_025847 [Portunus trituberculatus]|uniref:Uncharacterized protein n=1 Tax=Portunus trituberculatus TaxID=210409 RepID=A0A5B7EJ21_PORTR|nr:hypothetical protein [Portunus trituberculatus]